MTGIEYSDKSPVPWEYLKELRALAEARKEPLWIAVGAFAYGFAMGKRAERARRKAKEARHESV